MKAKKKAAKAKSRAKKASGPKQRPPSSYLKTASGGGKPVKQRADALRHLSDSICDDRARFNQVLDILRDPAQPQKLRLAAIQSIQAASFSSANFASCRPDYLATLRTLVDDSDTEVRQRVLGILARAHDGGVQRLLVAGIKDPSRALVPPDKALQLLAYDIHNDAYEVAREIVARPPNDSALIEALRLLAADESAMPLIEKVLTNRKASAAVRRTAAAALQSLSPEKLRGYARMIAEDAGEDDEVKAASLTALTDLGQAEAINDSLYKSVDRLKARSKSKALKKSAQRFIDKYRR